MPDQFCCTWHIPLLYVFQNQWFNEGRLKMARAISPPNSPLFEELSSVSRSPTSSPPAKRRELHPNAEDYSDDES